MSSPSRPYPSALSAISTESVIAHMPIPSAWAHLIRRLSATPSPRGEGSVAHQNFYVNITEVGRNRILTIGIRISRQCPPQARPMVALHLFFSVLYNFSRPKGKHRPFAGNYKRGIRRERLRARSCLAERKNCGEQNILRSLFYKPFRIYSA